MEFTDQNIEEIIKSGVPVMVDFSATWCGPCKLLSPVVHELEIEYEGKAKIGKLDIEENSDTATKYGIRNVPTLLFFKDGELVDKQVGVVRKDLIKEKLNKLI